MNDLLKSTAKFAIGTCVTLCAVTAVASVTAGIKLGKIATAGFKGAIKEELEAQRAKSKSNENEAAHVNEIAIESSNEVKASEENFEN